LCIVVAERLLGGPLLLACGGIAADVPNTSSGGATIAAVARRSTVTGTYPSQGIVVLLIC
jgi:hypothetical protein